MKQKLMNNLFLKIISVLIAILIWLMIANINDPIVMETYTVPVTIQNSAYIESIGKTYRVDVANQDATVVLRGPSSNVENRSSDIQAVADLTQIVDMETKPYVMVPIQVTCDKVPTQDITVSPTNMKVIIEEADSKEFVIGVNTPDTPDSHYVIGGKEARPGKVNIIGPASLIQKIDRVTTTVNVSGWKEDDIVPSSLQVIDKNQDAFLESQMRYLRFEGLETPVVDVSIDLWEIREEISIIPEYTGSPAAGYKVEGITVTPDTIGIAGTDEGLRALTEQNNEIRIPARVVDISGKSGDFEHKVDLQSFLPDETMLASDVSSAIIQVAIIPLGGKQFSVATKNITANNLDGRKVVFETDKVDVRVEGATPQSLTQVNENTVKPTINLQGKEAGKYVVPVEFTLPDDCSLLEEVTVPVEIMELE